MSAVFSKNRNTESSEMSFSIAEQLASQGRLIAGLDLRLTDLENELIALKNRVEKTDMDEVKPPEDYLTFEAYVRLRDIPVSCSVAGHLVSEAKILSNDRGAERGVTESGHITYRIDILDEVFAAYET